MQSIWIEFAATDLERASTFYAQIFGHQPQELLRDGARAISIIPGEPTVSLNQTTGFEPGTTGPLPYFELAESLAGALIRVTQAGGSVVEDVNERVGFGHFALILDTEGNHLYLHSSTP